MLAVGWRNIRLVAKTLGWWEKMSISIEKNMILMVEKIYIGKVRHFLQDLHPHHDRHHFHGDHDDDDMRRRWWQFQWKGMILMAQEN